MASSLTDSAAALQLAGNSLEQSTAILTAGNTILQDPQQVSTAMKVVSLRIRGVTSDLQEMGETTDDVLNKSKLQAKIKALTGVDIVDANGAFRSTYDILVDIGEVYQDLDSMSQASVLELLAGKTRANALAAVIQNVDILKDAYQSALDSEGSSLNELNVYMDSIEGRIDQFTNAIQTMWHNALDDELVKTFVNIGTSLVKTIDKLGLLRTILFSIFTSISVFKKNKLDFASILGIADFSKENPFKDTFGKEGLTGWIAKKFGKKTSTNVVDEILGTDNIDVTVEEFAKDIQGNLNKYVDIDTSQIDQAIADMEMNLIQARERLSNANGLDRDYYKVFGSMTPAKDRDQRIDDAQAEVKDLENQLSKLQTRRNNIMSSASTFAADSILNASKVEKATADLNSTFANFGVAAQQSLNGQKIDFNDFATAAKQIDGFNDALNNGQDALIKYLPSLDDADASLQAYLSSLDGGKASLQGFQAYIQQHNASVQASGIAAKAAAVGHALLNAAISMGISLLISGAITAVTNWINAEKEAAEAAKEAVSEYENANKTLQNNAKTISEIKDDYEKLSKGVDKFGNNVSLTTEEFERYNEISSEIADMFPELVSEWTSEGNVILSVKDNVEELTKAYEASAQAARQALLSKKTDIFNSFKGTVDSDPSVIWQSTGLIQQKALAEEIISKYNEAVTKNDPTILSSLRDSLWSAKGISLNGGQYGNLEREDLLEAAGIDPYNLLSQYNTINEDFLKKAKSDIEVLSSYLKTLNSKIQTETSQMTSLVDAWLLESFDYAKLDSTTQDFVKELVNNLDHEFYKQFNNENEMFNYIRENVIYPLQDVGMDEKINIIFNAQTQFNNSEISVSEYENKVLEFINTIQKLGLGEDVIASIRVLFDVDELESKKNVAKQLLGMGNVIGPTLLPDEITQSDLDIIDKYAESWGLNDGIIYTWEELKQKIEEAKQSAWSASEEFDKISESIDKVQSAYSSLSSAVKEYNQNGYLSLDTLQDILSLESDYIALLQIENGKLSLNEEGVKALIKSKLDDAEATAIQNTITQINALANDAEAESIANSQTAAENAISAMGTYASSISTVAQNALIGAGAVATLNAAISDAEGRGISTDAINAVLNFFDAQMQMINSARENLFNWNFSYVIGSDKSGNSVENSALDKIQNKYERKISNLSNQQEYIKNEIDTLEAQDKAVSQSYYQKQIDLEKEKMAAYEKELKELKTLISTIEPGTDEFYKMADAIWEVEHNIQEATKKAIEYRQKIIDLYKAAFDDIKTAYGNKDSLFDDQKNYIDKYNEWLELTGGQPTEASLQEKLGIDEKSLADAEAQVESLKQARDNAVNSGAVEEGSDEWVAMEEGIRAAEVAVLDHKIAIEKDKQAIIDLYTETFDKLDKLFGNKSAFLKSQQSYIEGYADLLETIGVDVPAEVYEELIAIEAENRATNVDALAEARQYLRDLESEGLTASDEKWVEANNRVIEYGKNVQDSNINTAKWNKTLREMDFKKFDELLDRIKNVKSEISSLSSTFEDFDVAVKEGANLGDWTDEGLARIGLAVQDGLIAKDNIARYQDEIDDLTDSYNRGEISEGDYTERLQQLKDAQWESVSAYEASKKSIKSLYSARVDMIEKGLNKEKEAYQDLIDLKKEELDAERDLYDFRKNITKQTKDIAEIERKIASLSGSTAASDIAERRKLEKELLEQQENLNDTYYDRAKTAQSNALDDEFNQYSKSVENYVEKLREEIENSTTLFNDALDLVASKSDTVLSTITSKAAEYGVTLTPELTDPWKAAKSGVEAFETAVTTACDNIEDKIGVENEGFMAKFGAVLKKPWEDLTSEDGPINTFSSTVENALDGAIKYATDNYTTMRDSIEKPWKEADLSTFSDNVETVLNEAIQKAEEAGKKIKAATEVDTPDYGGDGSGNDNSVGAPNKIQDRREEVAAISELQKYLNNYFDANLTIDGKYGTNTIQAVKDMQKKIGVAQDGKYGSATVSALIKYWDNLIAGLRKNNVLSSYIGQGVQEYTKRKNTIPPSLYAKGTTGTKKDQWAITDEPQWGDELTLVPGKDGNLSFMRKGTGVVPAELTERIMNLAMQNPADMMSNSIVQPTLNNVVTNNNLASLTFDSLVHIDNCDEGSIDQVKKIVNDSLDKFAKQLNYSLKKVGAY